jgi:hypothetical protein
MIRENQLPMIKLLPVKYLPVMFAQYKKMTINNNIIVYVHSTVSMAY